MRPQNIFPNAESGHIPGAQSLQNTNRQGIFSVAKVKPFTWDANNPSQETRDGGGSGPGTARGLRRVVVFLSPQVLRPNPDASPPPPHSCHVTLRNAGGPPRQPGVGCDFYF